MRRVSPPRDSQPQYPKKGALSPPRLIINSYPRGLRTVVYHAGATTRVVNLAAYQRFLEPDFLRSTSWWSQVLDRGLSTLKGPSVTPWPRGPYSRGFGHNDSVSASCGAHSTYLTSSQRAYSTSNKIRWTCVNLYGDHTAGTRSHQSSSASYAGNPGEQLSAWPNKPV
jgi:hypothetical protein